MTRIPALVSVIVPAFNAEVFIAEAIDSALNQTHRRIEVIVVDDGSTDATPEIVSQYDTRVKLLRQSNLGCSEARNAGVREAQGEFVAFLDADDLWEPEKLSKQIERIRPVDGIVYTNRINFGDIGALSVLQSDGVSQLSGRVYESLLQCNFVTTSSVMMRRDLFLNMGGFSSDLFIANDWDFWLRIAEYHELSFCPEPLVRYRVHPSGISKTKIYAMFREQEEILIAAYRRCKEQNIHVSDMVWAKARSGSAGAAAFAAANAGQWMLAAKLYVQLIRRSPRRLDGYKGFLKCLLRRA